MSYEKITAMLGVARELAVHQIVQLCGNGKDDEQPALLVERQEQDCRFRSASLSGAGEILAATFVPPGMVTDVRAHMTERILPALEVVLQHRPMLALGTLTVLLYLARHQANFGFDGERIQSISRDLGISNLTRHLGTLGEGSLERPDQGLVKLTTNPRDRRARLPELTVAGHALISQVAAILIGDEVIPTRRPRPQQLRDLRDSSLVASLDWDNLAELEGWDDIRWLDADDNPTRQRNA